MARIINASIDLSKIDKARITRKQRKEMVSDLIIETMKPTNTVRTSALSKA